MAALRCDNCDWTGDDSDETLRTLVEVHHLGERLDPGSTVPAAECPECGAFVYLVQVEYHRYEIWYFPYGVGQEGPHTVQPDPRDETCLAYGTLGDAHSALKEMTEEVAPSEKPKYRIAEIDERLVDEAS